MRVLRFSPLLRPLSATPLLSDPVLPEAPCQTVLRREVWGRLVAASPEDFPELRQLAEFLLVGFEVTHTDSSG